MLEHMKDRVIRARELYGAMSTNRKIILFASVAAVLAGFVVLLLWANRAEYDNLYSGLTQEDAGAIVAKLKERKIPFELVNNGTAIKVAKEVIPETRLALATEGLPAGGAVGMEMFDKTHLGETDFQQHLNYQRALQGELERTIMKFPEIEQVRVHLNIPKQSLFIEGTREPSASVVLKFKANRSLSRSQLAGIVHLVASSVEGLKPQGISIVDTGGGLLYSKDENEGQQLSATQIQHQKSLEQSLAERVTAMLERVVGPGRAMTKVTAQLNLQQVSTSEEVFDPDKSVVRSEQRLSEKNQGPARGASGVPNATYELGTGNRQQAGQGGQNETYEKSEETTNYEVSKINRQTVIPAGDVKKLSVAVMVDGTYQEKTEGGKTVKTFVPRAADELKQLEDVVKKAVGFDEGRGDAVVVTSVPFYLPEEPKWWNMPIDILTQLGKPLLNIVLIVLFFLFIVRPVMKWLQRETAPPAPPEQEMVALPGLAGTEELTADGSHAGPASLPEPHKPVKGQLTREDVVRLARENPDRTINLIRAWIEER